MSETRSQTNWTQAVVTLCRDLFSRISGSTEGGEAHQLAALQLKTAQAERLSSNGRMEAHSATIAMGNQNLKKFKEELLSTTMNSTPGLATQHKDLDDVLRLARQLFVACGTLPEGRDRTCARARAEECMAYIQKIIDEQPD